MVSLEEQCIYLFWGNQSFKKIPTSECNKYQLDISVIFPWIPQNVIQLLTEEKAL